MRVVAIASSIIIVAMAMGLWLPKSEDEPVRQRARGPSSLPRAGSRARLLWPRFTCHHPSRGL